MKRKHVYLVAALCATFVSIGLFLWIAVPYLNINLNLGMLTPDATLIGLVLTGAGTLLGLLGYLWTRRTAKEALKKPDLRISILDATLIPSSRMQRTSPMLTEIDIG